MRDLGPEIRRYYESVVVRVDPSVSPVMGETSVSYSLRTGLAVAAFAALVALLVFGLAPLLLRSGPDVSDGPEPSVLPPVTSTTQPESETPTTTTAPTDIQTPVNPLLAPFFDLAICDSQTGLEEWMAEVISEGSFSGPVEPADLKTAMAFIPILRVDEAACVSALAGFSDNSVIVAGGWMLLDGSGELIARAAGFVHGDDLGALIDDPGLRARNGEYHQDWIGSGQPITGWVVDGMIAADMNLGGGMFVRTTIEIPSYQLPTEGRAEGNAGSDLIGLLSMAELAPLKQPDPILTPRLLPEGVFRCWGPYWRGRIDPIPEFGEVTSFCDESGEVIRIGIYSFGLTYPTTFIETVEVSGLAFNAYQVDGGDTIITGQIAPHGELVFRSSLPQQQVRSILESIPGLDARRFNPSDGSDDYRPVFSKEWVVNNLTAIGATDIEVTEFPGREDQTGNAFEAVFRPDEDSTETLTGVFSIYPPEAQLGNPDAVEIQTYEQVTIFISRPPDGTGSASQAIAYCGGIAINIIANSQPSGATDPVVDTVRSLIKHIDC